MALFYAVPSITIWLVALAWTLRARIIVSDLGLRWRTLTRPWRSVAWEQVTDLYYPRLHRKTHWRVETSLGPINFDAGAWKNANFLAGFIASHASSAKTQDWDFKGERLVDAWPKRFAYPRLTFLPAIVSFICSCALTGFCVFGCVFWLLAPSATNIASNVRYLGLFLVVAVSLLCGVANWFTIRLLYYIWAHRDVTILATPTGIEWHQGAQSKSVTWTEITTLRRVREFHGIYELVWDNDSIIFRDNLQNNWQSFLSLIERFAPHLSVARVQEEEYVPYHHRRHPPSALIASTSSTFHFMTVLTRISLWPLTILPFLSWLPLVLNISPESEDFAAHPSPGMIMVLGPLPLLALALCLWLYYGSRLVLTTKIIERRILWFRHWMAWSDVRSFGKSALGIYISNGTEPLLLTPYLSIAYPSDLLAEIARRAPQATREDTSP